MTNLFRCYIGGCPDDAILSARHKFYGLVSACAGHNPIRHAYDAPLLSTATVFATLAAGASDQPSGGSKVLATPIVPVIPPSDGEAIALPGSPEPVKRKSMAEIVQAKREEMKSTIQSRRIISPIAAGVSSNVDDDII